MIIYIWYLIYYTDIYIWFLQLIIIFDIWFTISDIFDDLFDNITTSYNFSYVDANQLDKALHEWLSQSMKTSLAVRSSLQQPTRTLLMGRCWRSLALDQRRGWKSEETLRERLLLKYHINEAIFDWIIVDYYLKILFINKWNKIREM